MRGMLLLSPPLTPLFPAGPSAPIMPGTPGTPAEKQEFVCQRDSENNSRHTLPSFARQSCRSRGTCSMLLAHLLAPRPPLPAFPSCPSVPCSPGLPHTPGMPAGPMAPSTKINLRIHGSESDQASPRALGRLEGRRIPSGPPDRTSTRSESGVQSATDPAKDQLLPALACREHLEVPWAHACRLVQGHQQGPAHR